MTKRLAASLVAGLLSTLAFVAPAHARAHYPYALVDLGTLGGPQSDVGNAPIPFSSRSGAFAGTADTTISDPFAANDGPFFSGDPYVQHTFIWRAGRLTDLGALGPQPADDSSWPASINTRGDLAGASDDGTIDPLVGYEEARAVLWKDGRIVDLGTLGGNESVAFWLDNRDQVVGAAANSIPDAVSMFGFGTQTRAFLWEHGRMQDLGTLGGPDAAAFFVNDAGQVSGVAYTNSTVDTATGSPTTHPFLWQNGDMQDLGTLGGTSAAVNSLNDDGEVVGQSNLAGDVTFHPFLWNGRSLSDLGTFGGDLGSANWIDRAGQVVGWADTAEPLTPPLGEPGDQLYQAFLWQNGVMANLGTAPGDKCSVANSVNNRGQVVGNAGICHGAVDAFLSENGNTMNLNSLIAPSSMHLKEAISINDRGEISGIGVLPNGNQHAYILIPQTELGD
jgi:probable HAF family extracellular repeat protein